MDDIAVPPLSALDDTLQSTESAERASSRVAPSMTQRSDSSEGEATKPGKNAAQYKVTFKKKRTQFSSCDACVGALRILFRHSC